MPVAAMAPVPAGCADVYMWHAAITKRARRVYNQPGAVAAVVVMMAVVISFVAFLSRSIPGTGGTAATSSLAATGSARASPTVSAGQSHTVPASSSLTASPGLSRSRSANPTPRTGIGSGFVQTCGLTLCLNGRPFVIHGATTYGQLDDPARTIALARQARLNTLKLVEFETRYHDVSDTMSEATWSRVDTLIAAAREAGLHVVLHFSSYGKSLAAAGRKPTTTDWLPYLTFVATRVNTKTGVRYADDRVPRTLKEVPV